jgi:hypothetical protein
MTFWERHTIGMENRLVKGNLKEMMFCILWLHNSIHLPKVIELSLSLTHTHTEGGREKKHTCTHTCTLYTHFILTKNELSIEILGICRLDCISRAVEEERQLQGRRNFVPEYGRWML